MSWPKLLKYSSLKKSARQTTAALFLVSNPVDIIAIDLGSGCLTLLLDKSLIKRVLGWKPAATKLNTKRNCDK